MEAVPGMGINSTQRHHHEVITWWKAYRYIYRGCASTQSYRPEKTDKKVLSDVLPAAMNKNHDRSILDSLPPETPTHRYQDRRKLVDVVTRREDLLVNDGNDTQSQYLIVTHINEDTLFAELPNEHHDDPELDLLIHHYKEFSLTENILLLKVGLSTGHESLHRDFYDLVRDRLEPMGLKKHIHSTGSSERQLRSRRKRPDTGIQPHRLPPNRNEGFPSLIMEVGYSRSRSKTDDDCKRWICQTHGKVQIGLSITANRRVPELTIRKWVAEAGVNGIQARLDQEIKISKKKGSSQVQVTGGVLVIEFERLLLRAKDEEKSPPEGDIEINKNDLEEWAINAWNAQGF